MQQGGSNQSTSNDIPSSSFSDHTLPNLLSGAQPTDQSLPVTIQQDLSITPNSFSSSSAVGGVILGDVRGTRLAIESGLSIADFPTVSSCLLGLQPLPVEFNNGLQVVAENIDSWRTNLVTRIKLYSSTIADLKTTSNATSYACDINAHTNSSITTRIDTLAERFNQLEIRTNRNRDDTMLVCSMIDQLQASSDSQFSLLTKQLQTLRQSPQVVQSLHVPPSLVEAADAEHTVIIEGLCGKVKGLEQTIVTERNALLGLRDKVVDLSECVDSSLSTAMASKSASGSVLGERINISREWEVIRKGI